MSMPIYILKHAENNNTVFYHVDVPDQHKQFFIGIHHALMKLSFYETANFDVPIKTIDISDPEKEFEQIPGIAPAVSNLVTYKAYKALINNSFPESISHMPH